MMREPGIPDHLTPLKTASPQRLDGRWRSDQHDDGYRGGGDARQEIATVFHEACGLDDLFKNPIAVVAELGFGAGLSMLETIDRFREEAPADAQVRSSSVRYSSTIGEQSPRSSAAISRSMLSMNS